jgi:glycogen synthase
MRILFWSELFWPYAGGPELLGARLIRALASRGYDFTVVTSHDYLELPDEAHYNGIPVYRFPFRAAVANADIRQLINVRQDIGRLKRVLAPHLIHINALGPSALFTGPTGGADGPQLLVTLHTLHGQLENARNAGPDTLLKKTLGSAVWVTCVSEAVLDDARRQVPEITASSSVIYNGLEEPDIALKPLPFATPRLLCLGRLVAAKGFDLALNAFAKLIDRFPLARLIIAGDGPMRQALQEQAYRLGLNNQVEFAGWIAPQKVRELINTATAVVMPSRREGLPLVGIEAAQMARPVVATHVGGLPELIVHERTGLIVEKENVEGLTQAIAFLLDHPQQASRMGEAARHRARELFSLSSCIDAYDTIYRKLA